MVIVVLTGGIGSGKSAAAEYFLGRGAAVIDLDDVAARALEPGMPVLGSVVARFGDGMLRRDGSLDRSALARHCFADVESARRLDEIVHPAVASDVRARCAEFAGLPTPPDVLVVEVPLLAEAPDFAELGDIVVAIEAPEEVRVERAVSRGMDRSDVLRRVAVQAPDSARAALADVVVENRGTPEEFVTALDALWERLLEAGAKNG
jgi:dephospho-CoA kinase